MTLRSGASPDGATPNVNATSSFENAVDPSLEAASSSFHLWTFVRQSWILPFPALRRVLIKASASQRRSKDYSIGFSLCDGLLAMTLYLVVGSLAYFFVLEPSWSIWDALYFSSTCFTTVGYGDMSPSTPASKIFTTLFGLGGIAFLSSFLATVGSSLLQAEQEALEKAERKSRQQIKSIFHDMNESLFHFKKKPKNEREEHLKNKRSSRSNNKKQKDNKDAALSKLSRWSMVSQVFQRSLPSLFVILTGGWIMNILNGKTWSVLETIYFSMVTASTIGFGDFSAMSKPARMAAIIYLPLAVACAGEVFSNIALVAAERRQQRVFEEQFSHNRLSFAQLVAMDADNSGQVSREEYVNFMLLQMGLVDQKEIDELHKQFQQLDVTKSGYLDRSDLELMAKLKGTEIEL